MSFLAAILLLFPLLLMGADPDFYVWQRQKTAQVRCSIQNYWKTCSGKLYFIAGELENSGKIIKLPPDDSIQITRAVPVIRIHIRHMKKSVPRLAADLVNLYQPWQKSGELQIDLDAPESKIAYYRDLMKELRRRLPGVKLSATVLPCHLNHEKEFRSLAEACDYYVLQVHGLTKENGRWSILDESVALRALHRAKKLHLPFKTALPFYSNIVDKNLLIAPDMNVVSKLAKASPGIIGFRLGVPGDGSTLDLKTALQICRGEPYKPSIQTEWQKQENGAWHLLLRNHGVFARELTFACHWKKQSSSLNTGTFNRAIFSFDKKELHLIPPSPGESKVYIWIRSETPILTLKIKDKK